jgi:hypothetical protein
LKQTPAVLAIAGLLFASVTAFADAVVTDRNDPPIDRPPSVIVPYGFSTEALETGLGAVWFKKGVGQPDASAFLTGYGTSNSSFGLFGGLNNLRFGERLFFSPNIGIMVNDQQRFYGDYGYPVGSIPSGSNDSSEDDFVFGSGIDSFARFTFKYLLPIGAGSDEAPTRYTTEGGLLVDGSTYRGSWNPMKSGRTFIVFRPFYQRRTLEIDEDNIDLFPPETGFEIGDEPDISTNGIVLGIEYDNRDFAPNPSRGSMTSLNVTRDFGAFDSFNSWTNIDFSFAKYWDLGASDTFSQRVIATRAWTSYTPTWETDLLTPDIAINVNRPPSNWGSHLGGVERLRGYPRGRFNDKAAIYYGAELRLIPKWDPFKTWPIIRNWPWRWWQAVAFGELGRVAPSWDFGELHKDLKWSAGLGFRAMIAGAVIRLDWGVSEETSVWWVMARHPF